MVVICNYLIKAREGTLLTNVHIVKAMVFPVVVMCGCELDYKQGWAPKNWCFQIVVLEKTLESPLDCKIKPVNPKGNQSWLFIWRIVAEAETPVFWPPDVKSQLTHWKRPWYWERLKAGREGGNRGYDGWMASPTWWTWIWANFRN